MSIAASYARANARRYVIAAMKTVEEVRRERLQLLREEFGSLSALNAKLELSARDSTLSQYLNQSKGTKTGTPKVMGSPMARRLEQACGKEVGWMDTDPQLEAAAAAYEAIAAQVMQQGAGAEPTIVHVTRAASQARGGKRAA